ncbi:MAG: hypothetical protein M1835_006941 [Candelina submexicana]|nr:MAG: hypothetical protein M1835_006941 [Candelina submexicana]
MSGPPSCADGNWSSPRFERQLEDGATQGPLAVELKHDRQIDYDSNLTHVTDTQIEPDVSLHLEELYDNSQSHDFDPESKSSPRVSGPILLQRPPSSGDVLGKAFKMAPAIRAPVDNIGNRRFPGQHPRAGSQETPPPSGQRGTSVVLQRLPSVAQVPSGNNHSPNRIHFPPQQGNPQTNPVPVVSHSEAALPVASQADRVGDSKAIRSTSQPKTKKSKGTKKPKKHGIAENAALADLPSLPRGAQPSQKMPTPTESLVQRGGDILPPIPGLGPTTSDDAPYPNSKRNQSTVSHQNGISPLSSNHANDQLPPGGEPGTETKHTNHTTHQQVPLNPYHAIEEERNGRLDVNMKVSGFERPQRASEAATKAPFLAHPSQNTLVNPTRGVDSPNACVETSRGLTAMEAITIDDEDNVPPMRPTTKEQRARNPLQERRVNGQTNHTEVHPKTRHNHAKVEKPKRKHSGPRTVAGATGGQLPKPQSKPARSAAAQKPSSIKAATGKTEPHLPQNSGNATSLTSAGDAPNSEADNHGMKGVETFGNVPLTTPRPEVSNPAISTDDLIQVLQHRSKAEKETMAAMIAAERMHQAQNASLLKEKVQLSELVESLTATNAQCQERLHKFAAAMQGPDSKFVQHQKYMAGLGNDLDLLRSEYTAFLDTHRAVRTEWISLKEGYDEATACYNIMRDRVKELRDPLGDLTDAKVELTRLQGIAENLQSQLEEKTGMLATERDRNAGLERRLEHDALGHQELKDLFAGHRRSIMEKLAELHTVVELANAKEEDANGSKLDDCLRLIKDMRSADKVTPADIENINSMINALSQRFDESDDVLNQTFTASRDVELHLRNLFTSLKADLRSEHELTDQITQLREENARLGKVVDAGASALADARQHLEELQSEKFDLQQRIIKFDLEIATCKAQPLDSPQTVQRLKDTEDRNTELNDRLTLAQVELAKAEGKIQALLDDQNRLRPDLADLKQRFEACQVTIASFDRQKVDLEEKAEQRVAEARAQCENEANIKVQQQELEFNDRVHQLAQLRQAAEDRSAAAREEIESRRASETTALRGSEASLTIKGAELEKRNATLEERVQSLEEQLESKEVDLQNYKESQACTDDELRQVSQSLATAYSEGKKDKALIVTQRTDLESLRTQLANVEASKKQQSPRASLELQSLRQQAGEAQTFRQITEAFQERLRVALSIILPPINAEEGILTSIEMIEKRLVELTDGSHLESGPIVGSAANIQLPAEPVEGRPRRRANRNSVPTKISPTRRGSDIASKAEISMQKITPRVTFRTDMTSEKIEAISKYQSPNKRVMQSVGQRCPPETPSFARFEERLQTTSPLTPLEEVDFVEVPSPPSQVCTADRVHQIKPHPASKHPQTPSDPKPKKKNPQYDFSDESPPPKSGRGVIEEKTVAETERQLKAAIAAYSSKTLQATNLNAADVSDDDTASRYVPNIRELFKQKPPSASQSAATVGLGHSKAVLSSKAPLHSALKRKRKQSDAQLESSGTLAGRASKKPAKEAAILEIPDSQSQGQVGNGLFQQSSQASISSQSRAKSGQSDQAPPSRAKPRPKTRRTYGTGQRYNLREERFNKELDP